MKVMCADFPFSGYFQKAYPDLTVYNMGSSFPDDLDLLIMTGGEDVNPRLYGQAPKGAQGWNEERDQKEMQALEYAMRSRRTKILGVCRGMQLINVYLGGSLVQHIVNGHNTVHPIKHTSKDHPLSWLTVVNSLHHQGLNRIGEFSRHPSKILAVHEDTGIPEIAVWGSKILATQFHPEMMDWSIGSRFFDVVTKWVNGKVSFSPRVKESLENDSYETSFANILSSRMSVGSSMVEDGDPEESDPEDAFDDDFDDEDDEEEDEQ